MTKYVLSHDVLSHLEEKGYIEKLAAKEGFYCTSRQCKAIVKSHFNSFGPIVSQEDLRTSLRRHAVQNEDGSWGSISDVIRRCLICIYRAYLNFYHEKYGSYPDADVSDKFDTNSVITKPPPVATARTRPSGKYFSNLDLQQFRERIITVIRAYNAEPVWGVLWSSINMEFINGLIFKYDRPLEFNVLVPTKEAWEKLLQTKGPAWFTEILYNPSELIRSNILLLKPSWKTAKSGNLNLEEEFVITEHDIRTTKGVAYAANVKSKAIAPNVNVIVVDNLFTLQEEFTSSIIRFAQNNGATIWAGYWQEFGELVDFENDDIVVIPNDAFLRYMRGKLKFDILTELSKTTSGKLLFLLHHLKRNYTSDLDGNMYYESHNRIKGGSFKIGPSYEILPLNETVPIIPTHIFHTKQGSKEIHLLIIDAMLTTVDLSKEILK